MRYFVTVDDKEREVEIRHQEEGTRVRVGSKEYNVDIRRIGGTNTYSLLVDGKSFAVTSIPEGKQLVLKCQGESFRTEVTTERERAAHLITGKPQAKGPVTAIALMPGFVSRVLVSPEDQVEPGQPMVVIEAMKMQNEVVSEVAGVVREVHVEADQTVKGGDPLITLEVA